MSSNSIPIGEGLREVLRSLNDRVTDRAIHEAGGPGPATLTNWRTKSGQSARRKTLEQLDDALGWPRGTAEDYATSTVLTIEGHRVLQSDSRPEYLAAMKEQYTDYGPFWAHPVDAEQDAYFRRVADRLDRAVSAIRDGSPIAKAGGRGEEDLSDSERKVVRDAATLLAQSAALTQQAAAMLQAIGETKPDDD